jgi:hypothetical protein
MSMGGPSARTPRREFGIFSADVPRNLPLYQGTALQHFVVGRHIQESGTTVISRHEFQSPDQGVAAVTQVKYTDLAETWT